MATKRSVVVASAAANKAKKYSSDATTWGQLKGEISELLTGDLEAIVRPGNVILRDDSSVLPEGDFKLILIPTKNKAGISVEAAKKLGAEIGAAIVEAAEKADAEGVNDLRDILVNDIEDFFGVELGGADCEECDELLQEAKKLANNS